MKRHERKLLRWVQGIHLLCKRKTLGKQKKMLRMKRNYYTLCAIQRWQHGQVPHINMFVQQTIRLHVLLHQNKAKKTRGISGMDFYFYLWPRETPPMNKVSRRNKKVRKICILYRFMDHNKQMKRCSQVLVYSVLIFLTSGIFFSLSL